MAKKKTVTAHDQAINIAAERLKASMMRFIEQEEGAGHINGTKWTLEEAEYKELVALKSFEFEYEGEDAARMNACISEAVDDGYFNLWGDESVSDHYAFGFYMGAMEAWSKVTKAMAA